MPPNKRKYPEGTKRMKKAIKNMALAGLLLYGGGQMSYLYNNLYHFFNPSPTRTVFERQFGFSLKGWDDDIEENKRNISIISDVVKKEKKSRDFELDSIRIKDSSYLKQPIWDHLYGIFIPSSGYYISDKIVLNDLLQRDTIHHEIKHAKAFNILKEHPEFLMKWEALALDEKGESLYLTNTEQIFYLVRGLRSFINKEKQVSSENKKLGFVSNYARTNVYEDIAELSELAETCPQEFRNWLFGDEKQKNEIIAKKVALAQEYNLIPKRFTEHIKLEKIFLDNFSGHNYINLKKSKQFMKASEDFLKENPESVYEAQIRLNLAYVAHQRAYEIGYRLGIEDTIKEYKAVLTSGYKDRVAYSTALEKLAKVYMELGKKETSDIFKNAHKEYEKRFNEGEVMLPENGVNDFLIFNGVILSKKPFSFTTP
ncbi:MAG TPA: hypothetical protein VJH65_00200 [Candidatus Nanoarchaeia archaeon]|nr:hypothetical protein [Candidatus Nanoarchaeia archaeon]